jgi:hypothetical protein
MLIVTRRALALAALGAAALAATAAPAAAQFGGVNPFSIGVSGGAAVPVGDGSRNFDTGFSVDGIVAVRVPTSPISLRGEVGYTRFGIKDAPSDADAQFRIISGVANIVLTLPGGPASVVRPYLIGGVGAYNGRGSQRGAVGDRRLQGASETKLGVNGGVGIEIPLSGITGFGEVRYTSIFTEETNTNFVPIRFGIRF